MFTNNNITPATNRETLAYEIIPNLFITQSKKQYSQQLFAKLASDSKEIRKAQLMELVTLAKNPELTELANQTNDFYLTRLIQLADSTDPNILSQLRDITLSDILAELSDLTMFPEIKDLAERSNNSALSSLIKCATDHKAQYEENIIKLAIVRSSNDFNPDLDTDESKGFIPASRYYSLPERTNDWDNLAGEKFTYKICYPEVVAFIEEALLKGFSVFIPPNLFNDEATAIVAAYLIIIKGYDKEKAICLIRKHTGLACNFSDKQNNALSLFEKPKIVSTQSERIAQLNTANTLQSPPTSKIEQSSNPPVPQNEISIQPLHSLQKKLSRICALLKSNYSSVDEIETQKILDENYSIIEIALNSLKTLLSKNGKPDVENILITMKELPLAFNSIDMELKLSLADEYLLSNNIVIIISGINQEIERLEMSLKPRQSTVDTASTLKNSSIFKPNGVFSGGSAKTPSSDIQLGWNCFDVAVGLKNRKAFVNFALSHSGDIFYRKLLEPEIILAATLPPEESTALPASMRTVEAESVVANYQDVHEKMRAAVAHCNDLLNHVEGKRLSLDQLITFFENSSNIVKYHLAYAKFTQARKSIYDPAIDAFHAYASRQDTYNQYIKEYYGLNKQGQGGWFVFHNSFSGENKTTSMIDIAAIYLKAKITVYFVGKHADVKLHETVSQKGNREIEINWSGRDGHGHFVQRQTAPVRGRSVLKRFN